MTRARSQDQPRRSGVGLTAILLALLIAPLVLAARADAYVYWHHDGPHWGIGRANLNGSGVDERFINTCVAIATGCDDVGYGLAVGADHIYWVNVPDCDTCPGGLGPITIARANLDGSGVDRSWIGVPDPGGIAVDAGHIYWTESGEFGGSTIGRANLDGSGVDQSFIRTQDRSAADVAVDAGHVYWTGRYGIGRANLDGSGIDEGFITTPDPSALAVDAGHIYWMTSNRTSPADPQGFQTISRANIDGSGVDPSFITGVATRPFTSSDIAVDAGHVYWTQGWWPGGPTGHPTIGRANIDGSGVDLRFMPAAGDAAYASGVAVDALVDTEPPRTKITKGAPRTTKKTTLKFEFDSSEPDSKFACKLDQGKWKACRSPEKYTGLKRGKHEFRVRAIDAAGNEDRTPAKDEFKVVG